LIKVGGVAGFTFPEVGEEVHFQCICQLCRGFEREVDVVGEDLGDVRARDIHAPGELGLGDAQLLHAQEYLAEKRGADVVDGFQGVLAV